ncbi:MAG TPA: hypothetical protein VFI06_02120 [Chitinophagaceae bacterium]|nr:hypothetical protein [Chitinophagaceae bacterium]
MEKNEFHTLLQSLVVHWRKSAEAYAKYIENGKKFRYAEMLKLHNTAANNLLIDNITEIPDQFREDARAIIEHYTIWTAKWDELKSKLNPAPDDEFVFANDHRFPKVAAQNLETVFRNLSKPA